MEKQLNSLSTLTTYQNRQVILNYYQDDNLLYKRDGFDFLSIQLVDSTLLFLKKDGTSEAIDCKDYPFICINTDFQNYYTFRNEAERLEIYFP
jgi:hypothetical protein